jgi:hypothetical protein
MADAPDKVGAGGALVYLNGDLYAFRGNDEKDFWKYDIGVNSWSSLPETPAKVEEGGSLTTDQTNLFGFRGDDKKNFWKYNFSAGAWITMANAPEKVRAGGAIVSLNGEFYTLRGNGKKDFWKFATPPETPASTADLDILEYDTLKGKTPNIISISGSVYAIAYAGDGDDGFLKTFTISASGQITDAAIDTLEFDTGKGATPNIIPISGNAYAIAYAGDGDDGFLKTVEIATSGQITDAAIDTLEFDTLKGKTASIILISGNVYAVAYAGDSDDGFLKTIEIAANGQITDTAITTLEFDTLKGKTPNLIPVSGDVFALAYAGDGDDGFLKTIEIAASGEITDLGIDILEFDTTKGADPNIIHISGDVYAIAYAGDGDDGFLKTIEMDTSGELSPAPTPTSTPVPTPTPTPVPSQTVSLNTLEFDTVKGKTANIIPISGNVYAIAYAGDGRRIPEDG